GVVAKARQAVLAPAVSTRARLIVREVIPGGAMGAVVLAHGPPLALAQVRSPELPALLAACVFGEPHPLGRARLALCSMLDRHAYDSVLILDRHGSPPCGGEQPPGPATASYCRSRANHTKADWQFTTKNARIKLKHLYPAI